MHNRSSFKRPPIRRIEKRDTKAQERCLTSPALATLNYTNKNTRGGFCPCTSRATRVSNAPLPSTALPSKGGCELEPGQHTRARPIVKLHASVFVGRRSARTVSSSLESLFHLLACCSYGSNSTALVATRFAGISLRVNSWRLKSGLGLIADWGAY